MIKTVRQLVDAFGGIKPFAALLNKSLPPVYRAINENRLPHSWRLTLYKASAKMRLNVQSDLFGGGK
jgi:hypothetical protein